jgi:hypothetical protein
MNVGFPMGSKDTVAREVIEEGSWRGLRRRRGTWDGIMIAFQPTVWAIGFVPEDLPRDIHTSPIPGVQNTATRIWPSSIKPVPSIASFARIGVSGRGFTTARGPAHINWPNVSMIKQAASVFLEEILPLNFPTP